MRADWVLGISLKRQECFWQRGNAELQHRTGRALKHVNPKYEPENDPNTSLLNRIHRTGGMIVAGRGWKSEARHSAKSGRCKSVIWRSVDCNQLRGNLSENLPTGPGVTGWSRQKWVVAGWCQAKWACQACAALAPCLLSQLLTQSPVSSTLNGSSRCYSAPVVGWSAWLMNTFPNEGNSLPTDLIAPCAHPFAHFLIHFFTPVYFPTLSIACTRPCSTSSSGSGLHLSASSHLSGSCAHSSHCLHLTSLARPTAIHQLFAISFAFSPSIHRQLY